MIEENIIRHQQDDINEKLAIQDCELDHNEGATKRRQLLDYDLLDDIYKKPLVGDEREVQCHFENKSIIQIQPNIIQEQQQQQMQKEEQSDNDKSDIIKSMSGSSFKSQRSSSKFKKKFNNKRNTNNVKDQTPNNLISNQLENDIEIPSQIRKINHLRVLVFILKFARKLKEQTSYQHFQQLQKFHYDIISDKSFFLKVEQPQKKILFQTFKSIVMQSKLYYFIRNIQVFSPNNLFIIIWQSIVLFMQLFFFIVNPLKAGFDIDFTTNIAIYIVFQVVPISIFLIEIVLSFNLGYYEKGIVITNRQKIMKHYLSGQFIIDALTISSQIINLGLKSPWLDFIFLLRIQSSLSILKMLDEHFNIQQKFSTSSELIKLVVMIAFVAHFTGCSFHFVTLVENKSTSWIIKLGIREADVQTRYINSLYYSFITMITVGYGDITPVTNVEKIFVIFITLISCGVFAYAVNTIGSIFREYQLKEAAFQKKRFEITNYMMTRNISKLVQIKVIKALEYVHQQEEKGHTKGEEILNQIQTNIREEVYTEYYGNILHQSKLFHLNFSDDCIKILALKMKEMTVAPNEILFKKGDHDSRILFLLDGEIELYIQQRNHYNKQDLVLSTLTEKCIIGYNGFFAQVPRDNAARSLVISRLAYCKAEDFIQILKLFPQDYVQYKKKQQKVNSFSMQEKYCMIRDNILFYNKKIDQQCLSCKSYEHSIFNCPLLHYKVDRQFVILRENYSNPQVRNKDFSRNQNRIKLHSMLDRDLVRDDLIQFRQELIDNFEPDENIVYNRRYSNDKEFYLEMPSIYQNDSGLLEIRLYDQSSLTDIDEQDEDDDQVQVNFMEQSVGLNKQQSFNPDKITQEEPYSDKELMHYASNISRTSRKSEADLHDHNEQQYQDSEGSILQQNKTKDSAQLARNMKRNTTYKKFTINKENINPKSTKQERKSEREYNKSKSNFSHSKSLMSQNQKSPIQQDQQKEKDTTFIILGFDFAKDFEIYFPHNNYSKICEEEEKRLIKVKLKKLQQRQKKRTKNNNNNNNNKDGQAGISNSINSKHQRHSIRDPQQFTLFMNKELNKFKSAK